MTRCFTYIFILIPLTLLAQKWDKGRTAQVVNSGATLMELAEYERADSVFKMVFRNAGVLPDEIAYYFGKNSYYLGRMKQSINWLNKYIELKGTQGQFFEDANQMLEQAVRAYQAAAENKSPVQSANRKKPCDPGDLVICPVCNGSKVIISKGVTGLTYRTCPYDNGNGLMTCEDFLLFQQGDLEPDQ